MIGNNKNWSREGQDDIAGIDSINSWLECYTRQDSTYASGRILGAMTTEPHPVARNVFARYMERNLGDAGLVPGTRAAEKEAVHRIAEWLGADWPGNFVSGGTEANILAMYLARQRRPRVSRPEILASAAAHVSFEKAADLLGMHLRRIPVDENFQVSVQDFRKAVNRHTVALVGVAGTTALGLVEPLAELGELAEEHELLYHIDGAFGAFVLPFLYPDSQASWGLQVPGVDTYTADPHKMGMSVIPAGVLLVRDASLLEKGFTIPYLAGGPVRSLNLTGTRPGASVLSFLGLSEYLGREGFTRVVRRCQENTEFLAERLSAFSKIRLARKPELNVLGIMSEGSFEIGRLDSELRKRAWVLGLFRDWKMLRIVLMPHVLREHLEEFLRDLGEILDGLP